MTEVVKTSPSVGEELALAVWRAIEGRKGETDLSPTLIANVVILQFAGEIERHVRFAAIEHLKQVARARLRRFDPVSRDASADEGTDLFSGELQTRYPIPVPAGYDPQYRLRERLTAEQAHWNAARIRKSCKAGLRHADALDAYADTLQ